MEHLVCIWHWKCKGDRTHPGASLVAPPASAAGMDSTPDPGGPHVRGATKPVATSTEPGPRTREASAGEAHVPQPEKRLQQGTPNTAKSKQRELITMTETRMPRPRPAVAKRTHTHTHTQWGKQKTNALPRGPRVLEGKKCNTMSGIGFLAKEAERRRAGSKSLPAERPPDKRLEGQTAEAGASWEKQQAGRPWGGTVSRSERPAQPRGWETRGTCRRPQRALQLGAAEDHAGRAAAGGPRSPCSGLRQAVPV